MTEFLSDRKIGTLGIPQLFRSCVPEEAPSKQKLEPCLKGTDACFVYCLKESVILTFTKNKTKKNGFIIRGLHLNLGHSIYVA